MLNVKSVNEFYYHSAFLRLFSTKHTGCHDQIASYGFYFYNNVLTFQTLQSNLFPQFLSQKINCNAYSDPFTVTK